jgi:hypothetical protein
VGFEEMKERMGWVYAAGSTSEEEEEREDGGGGCGAEGGSCWLERVELERMGICFVIVKVDGR